MNHEDKIEWKKCNKCGFLQYPTHLRCLKCKNKEFTQLKVSGVCKLLTYTILNAPPAEFREQKSLALGIVEFENGIKALGQITIRENLEIGMKLKPIYKKICENMDDNEVYAHIFEPI
ncbi:MAG: Zn-ribbon domain-containing OB-fold protein [Candidatus Thorarchaeota archaeon]